MRTFEIRDRSQSTESEIPLIAIDQNKVLCTFAFLGQDERRNAAALISLKIKSESFRESRGKFIGVSKNTRVFQVRFYVYCKKQPNFVLSKNGLQCDTAIPTLTFSG